MRKTNTYVKKTKCIKWLFAFLLIQIVIISVFSFVLISHSPVDALDLKNRTIEVERIEYERKFINGEMVSVFADSVEYGFAKFPVLGTNEYSMYELYETISIGDTITIKYFERRNHNVIVDAFIDDDVLRNIDTYSGFLKKQRLAGIIIFSIIEFMFLSVLAFYVVFNKKALLYKPIRR